MAIVTSTSLVLGRGKIYFAAFLSGSTQTEGERYVGNTPGFSIGRSVEEIQRFTSWNGQQVQLESDIIRETMAANIVMDSIEPENLGVWLSSNLDDSGQEAIGFITETFVVKRGRYYQLGTSVEPYGIQHVEPDITFKLNGNDFTTLDQNLDVMHAADRKSVV